MTPRRAGEQPSATSATRPAMSGEAMLVPTKAPQPPCTKNTSPAPALAEMSGTSRQLVPHALPGPPHSHSAGCQLGRVSMREIPPPAAPKPLFAHARPERPSQSFHAVCPPFPDNVVPPTAVTEGSEAGKSTWREV